MCGSARFAGQAKVKTFRQSQLQTSLHPNSELERGLGEQRLSFSDFWNFILPNSAKNHLLRLVIHLNGVR
jgi:hypothetical protein